MICIITLYPFNYT